MCRSQFFPSIVWIPVLELRSSGLVAGIFILQAILSVSLRFLTASSHTPEAILPGSRHGQRHGRVKVGHLWRLTLNPGGPLYPKEQGVKRQMKHTVTKMTKRSDREKRKAFFPPAGQKSCLALGIAGDVAVPAHLRRGQARRPEWRKIWERWDDIEHSEKQLSVSAEERQGLRSAGWNKLGRSQGRTDCWLRWRAASQWWVGGRSETRASGQLRWL